MNNIFQWFNKEASKKRAVAYYRHSAEDKQENSVPIQREHARKFAQQHGIEIIHEEADEGKTGLLANRPGFIALFENWIENDAAPSFEYVLVYDVSRWGRFQDQDESAHYQFRCTLHGKKLIFIEDGFPREDQQLTGALVTAMKRYVAAEFSRQLSGKVFFGCVKVSEQGYSAGGAPCYGMARQLLKLNGEKRILEKGEHKEISNERVTFVPRGDETTEVVKNIFRMFVEENLSLSEIASTINDRGIPSACGGLWNRDKIIRILMNETYVGTRIYNKTWGRLRKPKRDNPRSEWVIRNDAFPPVISRELFDKAQRQLWFALRKWREYSWAMRRAKALILKTTKSLLMREKFDEDEIFMILQQFPLLLSVSVRQEEGLKKWCFVLPEELGFHEHIIGVGVVLDRSNPADALFVIPIQHFGIGGICAFTEEDEIHAHCTVTVEELEKRILALARANSDQVSHQTLTVSP